MRSFVTSKNVKWPLFGPPCIAVQQTGANISVDLRRLSERYGSVDMTAAQLTSVTIVNQPCMLTHVTCRSVYTGCQSRANQTQTRLTHIYVGPADVNALQRRVLSAFIIIIYYLPTVGLYPESQVAAECCSTPHHRSQTS